MHLARVPRTAARTSSARKAYAPSLTPASPPSMVGTTPRRRGTHRMTGADTLKDLHVEVKRCPECGSGFGVEVRFCPFDGVALQRSTWDPTGDPLSGNVIDQRYEVIQPLGEGGMGTVYKVRHVTLDRMFA